MNTQEARESFGSELLQAQIPVLPEERRKDVQEAIALYTGVKTAEEAWERMIRENRKITLNAFTSSGLNSDVFNDITAIRFELDTIKEGETFQSHLPKHYMEYFVEKEKSDLVLLEFIRNNSDASAMKKFDEAIDNVREKMSTPVTTKESIRELRDGLRAIYRVIYLSEPTF